MEWVDHRLEYHNLHQGAAPNILAHHELQKIWTPSLVFANTENREVTSLNHLSEVMVRKVGNATKSNIGVPEEISIYKGEENSLVWTENYVKTIKCVFNLEMFPFDIQVT